MNADSPGLAWIRERLDYANRAAYARTQKPTEASTDFAALLLLNALTIRCPLCGAVVLNDGTFEACGDCPEGE